MRIIKTKQYKLSQIIPYINYNFSEGKERAKKMSDQELIYAIKDLREVIDVQSEAEKKGYHMKKLWYYMDELHTYAQELNNRRKEFLPKKAQTQEPAQQEIENNENKVDPEAVKHVPKQDLNILDPATLKKFWGDFLAKEKDPESAQNVRTQLNSPKTQQAFNRITTHIVREPGAVGDLNAVKGKKEFRSFQIQDAKKL